MKPFDLGSRASLKDLLEVSAASRPVRLSVAVRARARRSRRALEAAVASGCTIYGVNTGFGELASKRISREDIGTLNYNYVRSHASGVGAPLSATQARAVMFLRANELARGHSACRVEIIERLAALLNFKVTPVIPSRGSVGASGDLAPLAHVALALIGEGEAWVRGRALRGPKALAAAGLKPIRLEAKEALSLSNGTQAMQAVGGLSLHRTFLVARAADVAGAMSLEALKGTPEPFDERISELKPHAGQKATAARLRRLLKGSEIRESHRRGDERVQDPYSLRCMPQVHGAVRGALEHALGVLETEMNSATDNPLLAGGEFISGGNFHGQALAMALDYAALAMAVLSGISERRMFQLIAGQGPGLSPFLAKRPGLESGYMIPQVAAAALASENKTLAHPASADSIPTSANKEDFVSMGMGAALKLERCADNAAQVVAIELLAAADGVEFHRPLKPGLGVARALKLLRARVPRGRGDEIMAPRLRAVKDLILEGRFEEVN